MDPFFHTGLSISDSLKTVRKSVLIYETIIQSLKQLHDVMTDRLHHSRKVDAAAVVFFEESRCKQAAVVRQI